MYTLTIYKFTDDQGSHEELGTYYFQSPPWVPPVGQYFRFHDPEPPNSYGGRHPVNHTQTAGYVSQVVTMCYGTRTTIEVYVAPPKTGGLVELLEKLRDSSHLMSDDDEMRIVEEGLFQKVLAACGVES